MRIEKDNPILTKKEYLGPSRYNTGRIIEYDIKSANINVLFNKGVIDKSKYDYLNNLPKMQREIVVGNMIKENPSIYHILLNGILEFRNLLVESNDIQEEEVVRVATDAIYVNRFDDLKYTQFDNVIFAKKSEYNNMVKLLDLIVFSKYINDNIDIDIKGIGNNSIYHQQFMFTLIANAIYLLERVSVEDALIYMTDMYERYVSRKLDIGFYRQLNSDSGYLIPMYNMVVYNASDINIVDINYNIQYLRELHNIIFEQYH